MVYLVTKEMASWVTLIKASSKFIIDTQNHSNFKRQPQDHKRNDNNNNKANIVNKCITCKKNKCNDGEKALNQMFYLLDVHFSNEGVQFTPIKWTRNKPTPSGLIYAC